MLLLGVLGVGLVLVLGEGRVRRRLVLGEVLEGIVVAVVVVLQAVAAVAAADTSSHHDDTRLRERQKRERKNGEK